MRLSGFIMIILVLGAVGCGYETRESKTYNDTCCDDNNCDRCKEDKTTVVVVKRTPEQRPPVIVQPQPAPGQSVDVDIDIDVDNNNEIIFECCDDYGCQPCKENPTQSDADTIRKPVNKPTFCSKYPRWHTCNVNNNTNTNNNRISVNR